MSPKERLQLSFANLNLGVAVIFIIVTIIFVFATSKSNYAQNLFKSESKGVLVQKHE